MNKDRRSFLKKAGVAGAGLISPPFLNTASGYAAFLPHFNFEPEPSIQQRSWMELQFGMFIHFGINTYYDLEWSDGTLDPYRVNPTRLNTMEWCRTAQEAGMKYIVMVCKHHDGFCLWPSQYSDYTIARSRFSRDILASLVNSCEKTGLKVGFYYSLWDQHEAFINNDDWHMLEFNRNQLEEILTGYGPVVEMWFDGFWERQQSGWTKGAETTEENDNELVDNKMRDEDFINAWRMEGAYRWQIDHLYHFIKSLQPDCQVMNNSTNSYRGVPLFPVDIRNGKKYMNPEEDRKIWNWLGKDIYMPLQIETTMSTQGNKRFPSGNWFWHEWDHSVLSREGVLEYLGKAKNAEANLLLNVGPSNMGELRKEDELVLRNLQN
jgi:alpha-L-fucosidase